jgi:hypothetical protein
LLKADSMSSVMSPLKLHAGKEPFGMETLLARAVKVFVGSAVRLIRDQEGLDNLDDHASAAMISLSASAEQANAIKRKGYVHQHTFIAIPSSRVPRWLVPVQSRCAMLAAAQMYEPHKWMARALKGSVIGLTKIGWTGWSYPKILIATKDMSVLERLVHAVTSEPKPIFALSIGRQAAVRKLTVQVMRPNGDILGYMKLPLTNAAAERVRNEASILEHLWEFPALRPHIPRLLYAGNCNGTYVLFQCALQGARGPTALNEIHRSFLQKLWDVHIVRMPAERLIEAVAAKWKKVVPRLSTEWKQLGQEALRRASRDLEGKVLRAGVMHGDFAPWNTRVWDKRLLLFDWESATWEAPISWDTFHFQVQSSYFFGKRKKFQMPQRESYEDISFMLYLLNSARQFLEEDNHFAVANCKNLLIRAFQERWVSVGQSAPAI